MLFIENCQCVQHMVSFALTSSQLGFDGVSLTLVKHRGHLSNTGDRASFYVKIITEGHCKKMFCKERRDRNSLAEKKTEGFAKGFFLAGGHGKRTEISFSDKLDALGERECLCQRWWNCCVREKQAPSSANPSCLFCGRVVGGAQVALGF